MKLSSTGILGMAATSLWVYLFLADPYFKTTNQKLLEEQFVYYFQENQPIEWVSIGEIEIMKQGDEYMMSHPYRLKLSDTGLGKLVEWKKLKFINRFEENRHSTDQLKDLGLDPPLYTLELSFRHATKKIHIGKEVAHLGIRERYVMDVENARVYTVSADWFEDEYTKIFSWVETKPFSVFKSDTLQVEISDNQGRHVIVSRNDQGVYTQTLNGLTGYGDRKRWDQFIQKLQSTAYSQEDDFYGTWDSVYGNRKASIQLVLRNSDQTVKCYIGDDLENAKPGVWVEGNGTLYRGLGGYEILKEFPFQDYFATTVFDASLAEIGQLTFSVPEADLNVRFNSMNDVQLQSPNSWLYESGKILNKVLALILIDGEVVSGSALPPEGVDQSLGVEISWKESDRKERLRFFQHDDAWFVIANAFNMGLKLRKPPEIDWIREPYSLIRKHPFTEILARSHEVLLNGDMFATKNSLGSWSWHHGTDHPGSVTEWIQKMNSVLCYHSSAMNPGVDFGFLNGHTFEFKGENFEITCVMGSFSGVKESFWLINQEQMWFCRNTDFLFQSLNKNDTENVNQGDSQNANL